MASTEEKHQQGGRGMSGTEDARVALCDECGNEGRIYRQSVLNPYEEVDHGPCSRCEGTGWMVVEVEPITEEELP